MLGRKRKGLLPSIEDAGSPAFRAVLLAVLSGIILTAAFPPWDLSYLAWFSLVPLFAAIQNASFFGRIKLGFLAGFVHFLTLIYWIVFVLGHYGNLSIPESVVPYILLCLYLSLYPALFAGLFPFTQHFRTHLILLGGLWIALEYTRSILFTGFPWCLLGVSQHGNLPIIQIADLCGVYGISFFIVVVNALIYHLFLSSYLTKRRFLKWDIVIALLVAGGVVSYGHYRLTDGRTLKGTQDSIMVGIVQGNMDQSVKWDPDHQVRTIDVYERLTRAISAKQVDLIVWPETATPFFFQEPSPLSARVHSLAREIPADLLFGSPAYRRTGAATEYYNRAYLLADHGAKIQSYDKVHLVPFGEYVPLKDYLSFVEKLVASAGDFRSGQEVAPIKNGGVAAGVIICFEAIFPELARTHARKDARLLVNLTNDAWFGRSSAPYQHLAMSVFRSVETRLPMVRAANTGFSALIEADGRIQKGGGLFTREIITGTLALPEKGLTFYARFGDMFVFLLAGISILGVLAGVLAKGGSPV